MSLFFLSNKHLHFFSASLFIIGLLFPVQISYTEDLSPQIKFNKTTHDFGILDKGEKVSVEFEYTNIGNAPLVIMDISSPCGCTALESEAKPLLPNEKSLIKVVFDTTTKRGPQRQPITIVTNEKNNNVIILTILADVFVEVEFSPQEVMARDVFPGEHLERNLKLINNGKRKFSILKAESSRKGISLEFAKKTVLPQNSNDLLVKIDVPKDSKKHFSGLVLIKTDHPKFKELKLKVRLTVRGAKPELPKVNTRLKQPINKK